MKKTKEDGLETERWSSRQGVALGVKPKFRFKKKNKKNSKICRIDMTRLYGNR